MLGKVLCLSAGCEENEVVLVNSKWSATVANAEILRKTPKWRGAGAAVCLDEQ